MHLSHPSENLSKTPLTADWGFNANLARAFREEHERSKLRMLTVRQLQTELKSWQLESKKTQFPAGPGNHAVIYKLFTWRDPWAFSPAALDRFHMRQAAQCFITCYNWTNGLGQRGTWKRFSQLLLSSWNCLRFKRSLIIHSVMWQNP